MKKIFGILLACFLSITIIHAQGEPDVELLVEKMENIQSLIELDSAQRIATTITPTDIKKHLSILASDAMEGRETGEMGQQLAAEYIAGHFKTLGFEPVEENTYFQKINIGFNKWEKISLSINDTPFKFVKDFYAFPSSNINNPIIEADEIIFLGYGIDDENYSDYKGVDVKGKVIMIYQNEPLSKDSVSYITQKRTYSEWSLNWRKKLETAKRKGVKAILFIEPEIKKKVSKYRDRFLYGSQTMNHVSRSSENYTNSIYISRNVAKEIIGKKYYKKFIKTREKIKKTGQPKPLIIPSKISITLEKEERILKGENVLGYIEGRDEELKDQLVIVSAHYDHLGKRGEDAIYNGADDNGSGTSTVLDIAEAFSIAQKEGMGPRRSILFLLVSGEEKGLLGSEYYAEHPVFPLENTIVNVNVDMIGRVDEKHEKNPNYIYVIGADRLSTELHDINENMNQKYANIELDYTFNRKNDPNRYYYRSDHYNFAKKGIPAIFYFSGVHKDYHMVTDTFDKINYEKTAKIGKLIFHTIWQLANQDKKIEVNVEQN